MIIKYSGSIEMGENDENCNIVRQYAMIVATEEQTHRTLVIRM